MSAPRGALGSDDGGGGVLWCWFSDKVSSGMVALLSSLPKLGGLNGAANEGAAPARDA